VSAPGGRRAVFSVDTESCWPGGEQGTLDFLSLFRDLGIKATFFVCGDVARDHPGLVEAILRDGHEVGAHGWRHPTIADPPERRGPLLPALSADELDDHLGETKRALGALGARVLGFRAIQFRYDARVLRAVARHHAYDSSGAASRPADAEATPLATLPVATVADTGVRFGTPILFSRPLSLLGARAWRLAKGEPKVLYAHSFDLTRPTTPLYTSRLKRWVYYDRCGPERRRALMTLLEDMQRAGVSFVTGAEALGLSTKA